VLDNDYIMRFLGNIQGFQGEVSRRAWYSYRGACVWSWDLLRIG
jgi:hypothetical protein